MQYRLVVTFQPSNVAEIVEMSNDVELAVGKVADGAGISLMTRGRDMDWTFDSYGEATSAEIRVRALSLPDLDTSVHPVEPEEDDPPGAA